MSHTTKFLLGASAFKIDIKLEIPIKGLLHSVEVATTVGLISELENESRVRWRSGGGVLVVFDDRLSSANNILE